LPKGHDVIPVNMAIEYLESKGRGEAARILSQSDKKKEAANLKKHDVTFEEASTVFGDTLSITIADPEHSEGEERFILLGMSHRNRLLVVAHVERGDGIRIISARPAAKSERKQYEQEKD